MSRQIIKQPNGKYCIFSSVVDNIISYNMNKEDIIEKYVDDFRKVATKEVAETIESIEAGKKPYYQFTKTFDQMIETIKNIYGHDEANEIKNLLNK